MKYMDAVCDLLYHIKYQVGTLVVPGCIPGQHNFTDWMFYLNMKFQFTGDSVKADAERIVRQLKNPLQLRLRFESKILIG